MAAAAAIPVAFSIFQGIAGFGAGQRAGNRQLSAGRNAASLINQETQQQVYDIRKRASLFREKTVGGYAGSGVGASSMSALEVMAEAAREFGREEVFANYIGGNRARYAVSSGQIAAATEREKGTQRLISGFATAASQFSQS